MMIMILLTLELLLAVSALLTAILAINLSESIRKFKPDVAHMPLKEVPSVTVCIPARNEVHAMSRCLERVLASDYKKLEIVVFDDSSTDNTSIIIRSFAQAGVRFVAGSALPEGWLGKNHALDVLAREASGTYVVMMNVDTVITPKTLSKLVAYMENENATMLSVIPERADGWRFSVFFGYLRYFWELTTRSKRNPAVAGSLWMIDRHVLIKDFGGFEPLKMTAAPESALAAALGFGAYRCLISDSNLGVSFEKKWTSQVEASRRLLFAKVGGTHIGAILALIGLVLLNVPTVAFITGVLLDLPVLKLTAALVMLFGMATFGMYTMQVWRSVWWVGTIVWPIVVFQELLFLVSSFIGHWRHTITWKGRPVSPSPFPRKVRTNVDYS